ncbi:MAG TPA: C39 family peptidase [Nitrospiraceae bacterium]|nr:C39 family peptidase [Nitrospiraceae bacterium]
MKNRMATFGVGLCLALLAPVAPTMAAEVRLHIPPVFQEHPSWCWAAVGEMVFKYYYVPGAHRTDYQCGIAQGRKLCTGTPNCSECDLPDGDEATVANMLQQYPLLATRGDTAGDIALTVQSKAGSLSEEEVKQEINEGRPIIAGVSPSGFKIDGISQHMALIVGYDDRSGNLMLTVNDPFPFEADRFLWIANPYQPNMDMSGENDGQYQVSYERFRAKIKWKQTMYRITCTGQGCPSDNHQVADGVAGKDDRDVIQAVLAASSGDFKTLRTGHKAVDHTGTTWRPNVAFAGAKQCLVRDKDDSDGARWSCTFKFSDRSEADEAVKDIVKRLRNSLPDGWTGTDLDQDSDTELYTKTDKFIANKPGTNSAIRVYFIDVKKSGRVTMYLSVNSK